MQSEMLGYYAKHAYLPLLLRWPLKLSSASLHNTVFVFFSFRNPGIKEEGIFRPCKEDQQHQDRNWQHQTDTWQTSHWTRGWRWGPLSAHHRGVLTSFRKAWGYVFDTPHPLHTHTHKHTHTHYTNRHAQDTNKNITLMFSLVKAKGI